MDSLVMFEMIYKPTITIRPFEDFYSPKLLF